jgi:enoyl-CoA hydratase/carnithine racemase
MPSTGKWRWNFSEYWMNVEKFTIKAVALSGSGKNFCSGQDISELVGDNAIE